jgi:hypothetical protein
MVLEASPRLDKSGPPNNSSGALWKSARDQTSPVEGSYLYGNPLWKPVNRFWSPVDLPWKCEFS